jgi:thiol-disulfide isomerase/thioredoxin
MTVRSWFGSLSAPEFAEDLDWINTGGRTIRLRDLRGRIVLLDFWTYGCINCRHVQPRLRALEQRFADTLTVIGVHAGKFTHERVTANLMAACDRQNVTHAVVNDRQYRIWRAYDVTAWPTVALIGAAGELLGVEPGELPLERMTETIEHAIADAEQRGILVRGPEPTAAEPVRAQRTLRFPGRALVSGGRLLVSDTGNGRVLACALRAEHGAHHARVTAIHDGFDEPQGLAVLGETLYVADRAGQSVWRIAENDERERVMGTGHLGEQMPSSGHGPGIDLRSPWGLAEQGGQLVVTMAGEHQLWRLDPETLDARAWSGTGGEEVIDGPLAQALLAQPTGVAALDGGVAFADCESSTIRLAEEETGVSTLVGKGLFAFGDRDGTGNEVLLQHAEDLAAHRGMLAVADTYNDRLKCVDPKTLTARPWQGAAGEAGSFREPAGISSDTVTLAVADTGDHRIVLVGRDGSLSEVKFA